MTSRDDYPGLLALSEMLPDRTGGQQARAALDEIDRLRRDGETLRTAYQRDLQGLRDERDALLARRDASQRYEAEAQS